VCATRSIIVCKTICICWVFIFRHSSRYIVVIFVVSIHNGRSLLLIWLLNFQNPPLPPPLSPRSRFNTKVFPYTTPTHLYIVIIIIIIIVIIIIIYPHTVMRSRTLCRCIILRKKVPYQFAIFPRGSTPK